MQLALVEMPSASCLEKLNLASGDLAAVFTIKTDI